jgi:hypothetical protein
MKLEAGVGIEPGLSLRGEKVPIVRFALSVTLGVTLTGMHSTNRWVTTAG